MTTGALSPPLCAPAGPPAWAVSAAMGGAYRPPCRAATNHAVALVNALALVPRPRSGRGRGPALRAGRVRVGFQCSHDCLRDATRVTQNFVVPEAHDAPALTREPRGPAFV